MNLALISNYFHTIKYLKFTQIYGQIVLPFKKIKVNLKPASSLRMVLVNWTQPILEASQVDAPEKLTFLNKEVQVSTTNNLWNNIKLDKLWLYNLHYFDYINSAIKNTWSQQLIAQWIRENPPALGSGFEPYPLSLRIVNWIKWILNGNQPSHEMLHSLAVQTRYLYKRLEVHLLGNHILANAKALVFSGLFFTGEEADTWFHKGLKLWNKELTEQILKDGGHFELSPMYHSIILEDLLDVVNLFKTYQHSLHEISKTTTILKKMFHWLQLMCHLDNEIAFFNDAAFNVAPTFKQLKEYANRLSLKMTPRKKTILSYLPDSGYCRLEHNTILLLADIAKVGASYQPGHAHADTLSFELSLGKQRLIVNSGTSTYRESKERLYQRSTPAHNTLMINDRNSSNVWKSFRVAKRAEIRDVEIKEAKNFYYIKASHDGYFKSDKVYHTRTWTCHEKELSIEDVLHGNGSHKINLFFHFHPDVYLKKNNDTNVELYDKNERCLALIQTNYPLKINESVYFPEFNVSIPSKKIVIETFDTVPIHFNTQIKFNL